MAEESNNPSFGILSQSVKDLSFENFVDLSFRPDDNAEPKMDIQVKVNTSKTEQANVYSVDLMLKVNAKAGSASIFLLELTYGGFFVLENFKDELMAQLLNIECPRLLFPFCLIPLPLRRARCSMSWSRSLSQKCPRVSIQT